MKLTTHLSTREDERLSWPCWLTYSGIISGIIVRDVSSYTTRTCNGVLGWRPAIGCIEPLFTLDVMVTVSEPGPFLLTCRNHCIFTSANKVADLYDNRRLSFVCLLAGWSKCNWRIWTKFCEKIDLRTATNRSEFGTDIDLDLDPGWIFLHFQHGEIA